MTIKTSAVTVTTTATQLSVADTTRLFEGGFQSAVSVYNTDATATVYLGGSDVTAATGQPVAALSRASVDLGPDDVLYGIAASGTVAVRVLSTGV